MRRRDFTLLLGSAGLLSVASGYLGVAHSQSAIDRLSLPGGVDFNGETYRLSWSSHPTPDYYKQEYLPAGQTSERFQRMMLIEAIVRGLGVNDAVTAQIGKLNKRKATDPTVNFAVLKNAKNDEVILDFILSAKDPRDEDIVEWSAYRYATLKGKGNESGVLLFGITRRAYGNETADFLRSLKSARPADINALAAHPLPAVRPID